MSKPFPMIPKEDFVISDKDMNQALGSNELKPCPFCGKWALSVGVKNPKTGNTVYHVQCANQLKCSANVFICSKDPEEARRLAIEQWNRRPNEQHKA